MRGHIVDSNGDLSHATEDRLQPFSSLGTEVGIEDKTLLRHMLSRTTLTPLSTTSATWISPGSSAPAALPGRFSVVDRREERLALCAEAGGRAQRDFLFVPLQSVEYAGCNGLGGHDVPVLVGPSPAP
jgi:hypothetical protein